MAETNKQFDLTQGGILKKLLVVSLPVMGTQFMQMTYNLTDMFWLGRIGSGAVAASGTVGMYMWLSMAFQMYGRMGAEIGVAQSVGRGDRERAKKFAQSAVVLAVVLGVLYLLAMVLFRQQLVGFFNIQESEVARDAQNYLGIVACGVPFTFVTAALTGAFNGAGNTRLPFFINALGLLINMVLDPLLIFPFGMGIEGAAFATVAAQGVVCALLILSVKKASSRPFPAFPMFRKPGKGELTQIFKWSLPVSVESMMFTFLSMLVSRLVAGWGAEAIAVQRVGSQVESLTWLIAGGYASAFTAFIGQNYGAGKWTRVHGGYRLSVWAMGGWGAMVTVILFFFGGFLFSLFLPEPSAVQEGVRYLRFLSYVQIVSALEATTAGCFRGMGKTVPPSVSSITFNTLRVPLSYLLSAVLGLTGVWLGVVIGAFFRCSMVLVWYYWYQKKLPRLDEPAPLPEHVG